jgi:hypothetical protein
LEQKGEALVAHNHVYQEFIQDQLKPPCDDNAISKLKVKESSWPVELFYNKVVNTFKKKESMKGQENTWLEFRIANEFEPQDNTLQVQYTLVEESQKHQETSLGQGKPYTKQCILRPF